MARSLMGPNIHCSATHHRSNSQTQNDKPYGTLKTKIFRRSLSPKSNSNQQRRSNQKSFFRVRQGNQGKMATARCTIENNAKALSLVTVNIKNYNANKVYLEQLLKNFDIVCIQEHWLYNFEKNNLNDASMSHTCFARSVDDDDPIPRTNAPGAMAALQHTYPHSGML